MLAAVHELAEKHKGNIKESKTSENHAHSENSDTEAVRVFALELGNLAFAYRSDVGSTWRSKFRSLFLPNNLLVLVLDTSERIVLVQYWDRNRVNKVNCVSVEESNPNHLSAVELSIEVHVALRRV